MRLLWLAIGYVLGGIETWWRPKGSKGKRREDA